MGAARSRGRRPAPRRRLSPSPRLRPGASALSLGRSGEQGRRPPKLPCLLLCDMFDIGLLSQEPTKCQTYSYSGGQLGIVGRPQPPRLWGSCLFWSPSPPGPLGQNHLRDSDSRRRLRGWCESGESCHSSARPSISLGLKERHLPSPPVLVSSSSSFSAPSPY